MDFNFNIKLFFFFYLIAHNFAELVTLFSEEPRSIENQYILRLTNGTEATIDAFVTKMAASELFEIHGNTHVGKDTIYLLKSKINLPISDVKRHIMVEYGTLINYASNNFIVKTFENLSSSFDCSSEPGEAPCLSQASGLGAWGLSRISQRQALSETSTHEYTWTETNDGSGVTIYIVDSGVYDEHTEFDDVIVHRKFTATAIKELEGDADLNGHGSHVAGIAVGKSYGVAKRADIIPVKVLNMDGVGSIYDILEGLSYVTDDVLQRSYLTGKRTKNVVNLSLGMSFNLPLIDDALRHGSEMGIIYVAAAGNSIADACSVSPASSRDAITVGATDKEDVMAIFSNHGACVDILAPGVEIQSAGIADPGEIVSHNGTSMAAPFVAGVVARYLSHAENATNVTCVKDHLFETAILDQASMYLWQQDTPNRILFAGCNTCFGNQPCDPMFENDSNTPWTLPPLPGNNRGLRMGIDVIKLLLFCVVSQYFLKVLSI